MTLTHNTKDRTTAQGMTDCPGLPHPEEWQAGGSDTTPEPLSKGHSIKIFPGSEEPGKFFIPDLD